MLPWKTKTMAAATRKGLSKPEGDDDSSRNLPPQGEKWAASKEKQVATIAKAPTLSLRVAVEWAVEPVNEYEWPGARDFAEHASAEVAKNNGHSKAVIRANPHNTTIVNNKRVKCGWHITVEFPKALTKEWVNGHIYTNSSGNEFESAATVNLELFPPRNFPVHKEGNLKGHVKYL